MKRTFSETIEAAHTSAIASERTVDAVLVSGPDAQSFLQGQASQDLESLAIGESTEALLLSPQGRIDAFVRIFAHSDDQFLVIADAGQGDVVYERLRRFKIRVKVTLEAQSYQQVVCLGPTSKEMAKEVLRRAAPEASPSAIFSLGWSNLEGYGVVAQAFELSDSVDLADNIGIETLRIEAGMPVMGQDLDATTIAEEAGLVERTVSFTKGCYTGQELVARLDARGSNVARRLRLIEIPAPLKVAVGDELMGGEKVVGRLTSVSRGESGGNVGLGYVARSVSVPGAVELRHEGALGGKVNVKALADH